MGAPSGRRYDHLYDALPFPQTGLSRFNPGHWFLPATALSLGSILAGTLTFIGLISWPRSRALFELPHPGLTGLFAAGLATALTWWVRDRWVPMFARLWTPTLGIACMVLALLTIIPSLADQPLLNILVASSLVSALALLPRFSPLRAHQWFPYRATPLTLLLLGLAGCPALFTVQARVAIDTQSEIDLWLEQLEMTTAKLTSITSERWSDIHTKPEKTKRRLEDWSAALDEAESFDLQRPVRLWEKAHVLGRSAELETAWSDLHSAVKAPFDHEAPPRLSELGAPAIQQERRKASWSRNPNLTLVSSMTQQYYSLAWRGAELTLQSMDTPTGAGPAAFTSTAASAQSTRAGIMEALDHLADSYTDGWPVYGLPEPAWGDHTRPGVDWILGTPLMSDAGQASESEYRAANLAALFQLTQQDARTLASNGHGCQAREYPADSDDIFRLDCTTFLPAPSGGYANPHMEARLVWHREAPSSRPQGLYYVVAVPSGLGADQYRDMFMNALGIQAQQLGSGVPRDKSRDANRADGFFLEWREHKIWVMPVPNANQGKLRLATTGTDGPTDPAPELTTFEIWATNPLP